MPFSVTNNLDQTFFEGILQESIKIVGINCEYWEVEFNQNKDRIYGEDTKPKVIGKYPIVVQGTVIQEDWLLSRFGMGSSDLIRLHIDIKEFSEAVSPDIIPKPGDYLWINYMNRLFIITDVDKEDAIFLQKKFMYSLECKAADLTGEEISTTIRSDITSTNYETVVDAANDNDALTIALSGVVREKTNDRSIFGDYD